MVNQYDVRRSFEHSQALLAGKQFAVYVPTSDQDISMWCAAVVMLAEHPRDGYEVFNGRVVVTSQVHWYCKETGVFETTNTRYVPSTLLHSELPLG